jgi:hypothetical protein
MMPMQLEMPAGVERVGVVLNDRGRFQLASVLGPATDVVEGGIARQDSTVLELNVYRVVTLRGEASTWTGESVVIQRDGIAGFRERRLSKARSWMLAGAFVGAILLSVVVLGLDGLGADEAPEPCVGPTCNPNPSIRW